MKTYKKPKRNKTGVEVTLIKRHESKYIDTEEVMLVSSSSSSLVLIIAFGFCWFFFPFVFCVFVYASLLTIKSSL